ncbi:hypothetical protein U5817_08945 [Aromatoleum evansii]|uniref:DUF4031 domain-containing protein n=1 Tax=Aromatoleum evansii TaxID=59406 RepID=A0ABZ1AQK7_AROEV|nr:hypothetical protein U5817_08945 [Aromatoleum evansii]
MFSNAEDHNELVAIAQATGLKRGWLQNDSRMSDGPLTPGRCAQALADSAIRVRRGFAMWIWRTQRARRGEEHRS